MVPQPVLMGDLKFFEPLMVVSLIDKAIVCNCCELPVGLDG